MKITKSKLKKIIREELERALEEDHSGVEAPKPECERDGDCEAGHRCQEGKCVNKGYLNRSPEDRSNPIAGNPEQI